MDVQQIELLAARDLGLLHRERQRVMRRLEEWVVERLDLVKLEIVRELGESRRKGPRDDVHCVTEANELARELRADNAAAAVRRVAGDAYLNQ